MLERELQFHDLSRSSTGYGIILHFHRLPYYLNSKQYVEALLQNQTINYIKGIEARHNSELLASDKVC